MSGLREHELFNRFHLAMDTAVVKPVSQEERRALQKESKRGLATKLERLIVDGDTETSGYKAGWNAAIVAAIGEVFK